jgi:hypothetical protein
VEGAEVRLYTRAFDADCEGVWLLTGPFLYLYAADDNDFPAIVHNVSSNGCV